MFQSPIIAERSAMPAAMARVRPDDVQPTDHAAPPIHEPTAAVPWLSAFGLLALLALGMSAHGNGPTTACALWAGGLVVATTATFGLRTRPGRVLPAGLTLQAVLWSAGALLVPPASAPVLAAALATLMAGGVLLAATPLVASLWLVPLAAGLAVTLLPLLSVLPAGFTALTLLYPAAILIACRATARMLAHHHAVAIRERAGHESIGLLLKEYEDQGIGWLWHADAANQLTYVSPRICVLLGRSTSQLIGQSLPVALGCDARLGAAIVARAAFGPLDVEVATPAGPRWVALSGNPVFAATGDYRGFRGVGTDVTEARRTQDRLTQLASIDMLTGLPNRQRLREIFAGAIADAGRSGCPCAILFLDLDGFKPVNDTFGHSIGDAVLRLVAQRLHAEVGNLGLIGRVGGDEFALLLPDGGDRDGVTALAHRMIAAIAEPFLFDKGEIRIGISVGCAFAPADGVSIDDLLLKADLALYAAKSQGRGTVRLFDGRMQREAEDRLRLEQDLARALDRHELRIAYQPIVAAHSQDVLGFEALLRWDHPDRGLLAPAVFIPLAEDSGMIGRIGAWVIEQACRDAVFWPDQMFVSVNLSPRQLLDPALPHAVGEALARARLQPNRLELEVTESVFMGDSDGSLDVLRRLRALGIGIALDDFGTGYSSLGYLNKTIFHTLKIDGSFIRDAATKSETNAIIGAIVSLANSFRMQITAEGIETVDDLERMRDFGCHKLQGFLFGRPMWHAETLGFAALRHGDDWPAS